MFPGENPLGKQIQPGRSGPWLTVVGVAGNVKNSGLIERDDPEYYVVRQHAPSWEPTAPVIIRGAMDPSAMSKWVRAEVAALDPTLPVKIETAGQRIGKLAERPRFNAFLLGIFAAMGLVLSAIGLYGVVSFLVAQRTREIGVRMALGATPRAVSKWLLAHAARWTAAGIVLGAAGSLGAARGLQAMLFHVSATEPWLYVYAFQPAAGRSASERRRPDPAAAQTDSRASVRVPFMLLASDGIIPLFIMGYFVAKR